MKASRDSRERDPTIVDIASLAGVSKTTVSRVINGATNVAPDTGSRVLEVSRRLGFRINPAARSLRTSRSAMVGLMVPMLREPFALIAEGLDQALAQEDVGLVIACSRWDASYDVPTLETLRSRGVDACVVSLADDRSQVIGKYLRDFDRPIVLLDRDVAGVGADAILTDQEAGLRDAVDHLTVTGRRAIGLITLTNRTRPGRHMYASFRSACLVHGTFRSDLVIRADEFDRGAGHRSATILLERGADAIVIGPSASLTAGVLDCLTERSLRVPGDIALISFDENELASAKQPRLSVISRQIEAIGRFAGELVLSRIANPNLKARTRRIGTGFVPRESTSVV